MSEELKCPICGKPTAHIYGNYNKYGLCIEHSKQEKAGEIEQCPDCGKWNKTGETCDCKKNTHKEEPKNNSEELTCIICGKPSNGKHFCLDCWKEYKDKSIDIRIKNCTEIEIIDKYGNQQYKCDDGRKVRSKSEKIISDFLFKYGIRTIYEKTVYYYPDNEKAIELHPDFYLIDKDIYIEHNGVNSKSYKNNKIKTQKMYEELGYKVIVTTEEDLADIEAKLKPILRIN